MQSTHTTPCWLSKLLNDIPGTIEEVTPDITMALAKGFGNLPSFLQEFCYLYYVKGQSLQEVAAALGINDHLAKQRRVVSISLFRILLASKPKNPV